jgi:hypothetical protein
MMPRRAGIAHNVWRLPAVARPDYTNERVQFMNDAYQQMGGVRHRASTITYAYLCLILGYTEVRASGSRLLAAVAARLDHGPQGERATVSSARENDRL